jgi:hypothetical protein
VAIASIDEIAAAAPDISTFMSSIACDGLPPESKVMPSPMKQTCRCRTGC